MKTSKILEELLSYGWLEFHSNTSLIASQLSNRLWQQRNEIYCEE